MYLFEMKTLPKKADKATLEWDRGVSTPQRDSGTIALPQNPDAEYYRMREGKQFLYRQNSRMWFGGTDEEPFLVEMDQALIRTFVQARGSEEAFYRALVPENVLNLMQETNGSYRRQGDIFAARFCGDAYFHKSLAMLVRTDVRSGSFNILGTRHVGTGTSLSVSTSLSGTSPAPVLFKGKIEAPDHAPLHLEDGYYLLGQTKHIIDPRNAD